MKALALLGLVLFIAISCTDARKFKAAIVTLDTDWQETTQRIQTFSYALTSIHANWDTLDNSTALPRGTMDLLSDSIRTKVRDLQRNFTNYGGVFFTLGRDYRKLATQWDKQKEELAQLNGAVANNEKIEDIDKKIIALQEAVIAANSNLRHWTDELNELQTNITNDTKAFDALRIYWKQEK